ncbi:hypothetical protein BWQ96_07760 [Gracilariopsis chorda]|uniref:Uncharacterized protein n=1 Tax=Gracilariopsis chorda TaxID=448386 RepID=A0A2V3IKC3_9FLOR|nr:hypothetical protein BWQ96_07760 [Gracilariopsis chorda]|eukprot:PXF42498.1 hypothetical protein BWQ96_07760 [Gracilariopsis chorda]
MYKSCIEYSGHWVVHEFPVQQAQQNIQDRDRLSLFTGEVQEQYRVTKRLHSMPSRVRKTGEAGLRVSEDEEQRSQREQGTVKAGYRGHVKSVTMKQV